MAVNSTPTGADHLHGGEAAMLTMLIEKLAGVGIRARGAIADTWGAAHAHRHWTNRCGAPPRFT